MEDTLRIEKAIPKGAANSGTADGITELYFALQCVLNWKVPGGSIAEYCIPHSMREHVREVMERSGSQIDSKLYKKLLDEKGPTSGTW